MKKTPLNPISKKRAAQKREYDTLVYELVTLSGAKSELNGEHWGSWPLECHHIEGRIGAKYLDPFNLILVTPAQHREIHAHNTWEMKQKLKEIVRPIRIKQGFLEEAKSDVG